MYNLYHAYRTPDQDKEMIEELFLLSSVKELTKLMRKSIRLSCDGCHFDCLSQMEHECMTDMNFYKLSFIHFDLAAPQMINKLPKILAEMERIISEDSKYQHLTLSKFLEFYNQPYYPNPVVRIASDSSWRGRLMDIIEKNEKEADENGNLQMVTQPSSDIESEGEEDRPSTS